MKTLVLIAAFIITTPSLILAELKQVAPNGIEMVSGYRSWEAIAPSYRAEKNHIRLILGNPVAVKALKENIRPFPDGAIMAKIAWNESKHPKFPVATVPDSFSQVEFMIKDSAKYKETGDWGFARFIGKELKPYGKDATFVQECFGCHQPVKGNDFVFTGYAEVP